MNKIKEYIDVEKTLKQINFNYGALSKYDKDFVKAVLISINKIGVNATSRKFKISKSTIRNWRNPDRNSKYQKTAYNKNTKYYKEKAKQYYEKNKEECIKKQVEYHRANPNIQKKWYNTHKKQIREYMRNYEKERKKVDPQYKLGYTLRHRVRTALKECGMQKNERIKQLIGCSIDYLKNHLESQFKDGMNWENHGQWHVDHIKPCSLFNLTELEEQKKCFHYSNLQPLWAIDNLKKGDKYKPSLCIINCASFKKKHPCPASQMYDDSKLFRTARDYAQYNFDEYIILSAKYGVLYPNQIIEPYEDTVMFVPNTLLHSGKKYKHLLAPEKREWANNVKKQINPKHYENITFLVGKYYWEFLEPLYKDISNVTKLDLPTGISAAIKFIENLQETM